jgi:integrase
MHIREENGKYVLDYYVKQDGVLKRREERYETKKQAELTMAKRRVEIFEGRFDVKRAPRVRFEEMAAKYMDWARVNKRSWDRDELSLKHLAKEFGGKRLDQVSAFQVERYKSRRRAEVAPATVNRELACLRHVFSKAIAWGLAGDNPVRKVKLFREDNQRLRFLTVEEFKNLVACCPEHLRPLVIAAFHTGMRRGELLRLQWVDVDFQHGLIHVRDSKNGTGRRIPMNGVVAETMRTLKGNAAAAEHVFRLPPKMGGGPLKDPRWGFEEAVRRAGLEQVCFHTIRHSFASHLVMRGVNLKAVQELMGHKTFAMTLRYAHLSPAHAMDAVRSLEGITGDFLETSGQAAAGSKAPSG